MSTSAPSAAIVACRESIAHHSKSFALASKLLPAESRDDTAVLYAWCRRADDAVDEVPRAQQAEELARLHRELVDIYAGASLAEPTLAAFQEVVQRANIPAEYPKELVAGMAMDVDDQSYPDVPTLLLYCYRVASTVGLMMSHVIGLSREQAMTQAAHMGIAMQLTNICRDVLEDWQRGRLYLPDELLAKHGVGDLRSHLGQNFPEDKAQGVAAAVRELLTMADQYYRSGDRGLSALPWRAAFGVKTARLVYSDIGRVIRRRHCDVLRGRAIVSKPRKLFLVARAGLSALFDLPRRGGRRLLRGVRHQPPATRIEFSHDVFCH